MTVSAGVRLITQTDVPELLPMAQCIDVMRTALIELARGDATMPLRTVLRVPGGSGLLGVMPACSAPTQRIAVKVITVTPENRNTPYDSHQGVVLLFESSHGQLLAILDATSITAIRTAAVSAVATALLAREDAAELALLGSGVQARTHLEAMLAVRPIRRARVWSPHAENARAFAADASRRFGVPVEPKPSAREAALGADVICTTTSATQPVLLGEWISPGCHVNAVGACLPTARELDTPAVKRARVFVDSREAALHEAGDLLLPLREGAIGEAHIRGELGEALLGKAAGRGDREEITLFKSLGLAVEDLAAADHAYRNALATGRGQLIEMGGRRD